MEDIYYYRFILKLSLDPEPNWWAKFHREAQAYLSGWAGGGRGTKSREPSPTQSFMGNRAAESVTWQLPDTAQVPDSRRSGGGRAAVVESSRQYSGASATASGRGGPPFFEPMNAHTYLHPHRIDPSIPSANTHANTHAAAEAARAAREVIQQSQQGSGAPTSQQFQTPEAATTLPRRSPNPATGGRGRWPGGRDAEDDSDWEGSDAEAYVDFKRAAKSFRTWRNNAFVIRESR